MTFQVQNCTFPNSQSCSSSVEMENVKIEGDLLAGSFVVLRNTRVKGQISGSSINLDRCAAREIKAISSVTLNNCHITSIKTGHYVEVTRSAVNDIWASSVKLGDRSRVFDIQSKSYVQISDSEVSNVIARDVRCYKAEIKGYIQSKGDVELKETGVSQFIKADGSLKLIGCKVAGCVSGQSTIDIRNSETGTVKAATGDLFIENSRIIGDVETLGNAQINENCQIEGILKCSNLWLKIFDSQLQKIILRAPRDTKNLVDQLKKLRDSRQIELSPNRIRVGSEVNGYRSICSIGSIRIESSIQDICPQLFMKENSLTIKVGNVSITAHNSNEISKAIQEVLNSSEIEPDRQTVILHDSHVKEIIFEEEGGLVKLVGSSGVEIVRNGMIENIKFLSHELGFHRF